MPILPLPQFEADLEADKKVYAALQVPKSLVVRFGSMKMVGEFPYDGSAKPGCGSKIVVKTHRGTELGEMLTSTCPNSGCSKSVSRQEMLRYIDNSGGKDYPFFTDGRVLRVATLEDLDAQNKLEQSRHGLKLEARRIADETRLPLKIVDVEPILGGERLTIFYLSEDRMDVAVLARKLQEHFRCKLDLKHVGARDEARLTADYEKCGQYCCCKNFLKVLKPISMKAAKTQKATLDPLKISGRCGRLMCCLRYEDETYEELRKRLPNRKKRVGTPHGDGFVVDSQILTQLVLVHLDYPQSDGKTQRVAVPVEELTDPVSKDPPPMEPAPMGQGPRSDRGPRDDRPRDAARRPDTRPPMRPDVRQDARPDARPETGPEARPSAPRPINDRPPRRDDRPREDRPRDQAPRDQAPRPSQPPRQDRPPSRPAHDDLDDIMDALDSGHHDHHAPPPRHPDQRADNAPRRGKRRRRGGPGGPHGPAGPGSGPSGPSNSNPGPA